MITARPTHTFDNGIQKMNADQKNEVLHAVLRSIVYHNFFLIAIPFWIFT